MKKYVLTLALATIQLISVAQTVNIHFKNGQVLEYPSSNVDYVDFTAKASAPSISAGEAVDLGLSVYWASCNLGASKPEEDGGYYAWGETNNKETYTEANYSYYDSSTTQFTFIGENISNTEYDAAKVNLGNNWRMPTKDEYQELVEKCTWEWTQINNVNGYKVIGSNGNSIFLPASGFRSSVIVSYNSQLLYWSSNMPKDLLDKAYPLEARSSYRPTYTGSAECRYWGGTIRPVKSKSN